MALFKNKHHESTPLIPASSAEAEQVLATLERTDIDPTQVLLVGSAALALYGATLERDFTTGEPRPGDVDLLASTTYASQLYAAERGTIKDLVNNNHLTVLRLSDGEPLPIDIITAPRDSLNTNAYDQRLYKRIQEGRQIEGTDYRVLSLAHLIKAKKADMPAYDPKAASDLASARATLTRIQRRQ